MHPVIITRTTRSNLVISRTPCLGEMSRGLEGLLWVMCAQASMAGVPNRTCCHQQVWEHGETGTLVVTIGNVKWCSALENSMAVLQRIKVRHTIRSSNSVSGILNSKELKISIRTGICVLPFMMELFTIAKSGCDPCVHWWMHRFLNVVCPDSTSNLEKEENSDSCYHMNGP